MAPATGEALSKYLSQVLTGTKGAEFHTLGKDVAATDLEWLREHQSFAPFFKWLLENISPEHNVLYTSEVHAYHKLRKNPNYVEVPAPANKDGTGAIAGGAFSRSDRPTAWPLAKGESKLSATESTVKIQKLQCSVQRLTQQNRTLATTVRSLSDELQTCKDEARQEDLDFTNMYERLRFELSRFHLDTERMRTELVQTSDCMKHPTSNPADKETKSCDRVIPSGLNHETMRQWFAYAQLNDYNDIEKACTLSIIDYVKATMTRNQLAQRILSEVDDGSNSDSATRVLDPRMPEHATMLGLDEEMHTEIVAETARLSEQHKVNSTQLVNARLTMARLQARLKRLKGGQKGQNNAAGEDLAVRLSNLRQHSERLLKERLVPLLIDVSDELGSTLLQENFEAKEHRQRTLLVRQRTVLEALREQRKRRQKLLDAMAVEELALRAMHRGVTDFNSIVENARDASLVRSRVLVDGVGSALRADEAIAVKAVLREIQCHEIKVVAPSESTTVKPKDTKRGNGLLSRQVVSSTDVELLAAAQSVLGLDLSVRGYATVGEIFDATVRSAVEMRNHGPVAAQCDRIRALQATAGVLAHRNRRLTDALFPDARSVSAVRLLSDDALMRMEQELGRRTETLESALKQLLDEKSAHVQTLSSNPYWRRERELLPSFYTNQDRFIDIISRVIDLQEMARDMVDFEHHNATENRPQSDDFGHLENR
eukprot:Clim_evm11s144 gene=Clim_evmTU11s144